MSLHKALLRVTIQRCSARCLSRRAGATAADLRRKRRQGLDEACADEI